MYSQKESIYNYCFQLVLRLVGPWIQLLVRTVQPTPRVKKPTIVNKMS